MAQIINITSQKNGSVLDLIQNTVARDIANPKSESRKIILQFIYG
jgi:hypothetical protein